MCETTDGNENPPRPLPPTSRRRRRHPAPSDPNGAVDRPPPVGYPDGGWKPRSYCCRTPQHLWTLSADLASSDTLGTSTWSTSPLVWKDKYLLLGTTCGKILVWDIAERAGSIHKDIDAPRLIAPPVLGPDAAIDLSNSEEEESVLHLAVVPSKAGSPLAEGAVLAVSKRGTITVVVVEQHRLEFSTAHSWSVDDVGISCVAVADDQVVLLGYRHGLVEAWTMWQRSQEQDSAMEPVEPTEDIPPFCSSVTWRAGFEFEAPHVRSIAQFRAANQSDSNLKYIVMTLQREERTSSAASIEVIQVSGMSDDWEAKNDPKAMIPLEDHWVLPEAGMEIVEASTISTGCENDGLLPRRSHWIPSLGSDSLFEITSSEDDGSAVACVAALADGTVALLTARELEVDKDRLSWGVANAKDQLLLSYPAIGCGSVQYASSGGQRAKKSLHAVVCLRGGTAYLLPVSNDQDADVPLTVFSYPHEVDDDATYQHLQGFSASCIESVANDGHDTPVMMYAWPGGLVDVYSCGLVDSGARSKDSLLLEALVSNETVDVLKSALLDMDDREIQRRGNIWLTARREVEQHDKRRKLSLADVMSEKLAAFRSILLLD